MAHFAKVEDGNVTQVIVVANEDCDGGDYPKSEAAGQAFIKSLGLEGDWLQASYSGSFRGIFPATGYTYNEPFDKFLSPKPFPSWHLSGTKWVAPIAEPNDDNLHKWDEESGSWLTV